LFGKRNDSLKFSSMRRIQSNTSHEFRRRFLDVIEDLLKCQKGSVLRDKK